MYINVYEVTRKFGGHEEGGWYYDNYECIHTHKLEAGEDEAETIAKLQQTYSHKATISGGVKIRVFAEDEKAEYETKEIPYYS